MRIEIRNRDKSHLIRLPTALLFSRIGWALLSRSLKGALVKLPRRQLSALRQAAKRYMPKGWVLLEVESSDGELVRIIL